MEDYKIRVICNVCGGVGSRPDTLPSGQIVNIPCTSCGATGFLLNGIVDGAEHIEEIINSINGIIETQKIHTEYLEKILANLPK